MELISNQITYKPFSELYQGTIERLELDGYFTHEQEDHLISELQKLQKLIDRVCSVPKHKLQYFCDELVLIIKSGNCPMIPMAISMIYYNLTRLGADTSEFKNLLDANCEIQIKMEETLKVRKW